MAKLHCGVKDFLVEAISILQDATKQCKDISPRVLVNICFLMEIDLTFGMAWTNLILSSLDLITFLRCQEQNY